jgi:peroxiredoxin
MALTSKMAPLGSPAPDFALPTIDGREVALADFTDAPALLVMFLCNHCPYVRHIESILGKVTREFMLRGLAVVGICSNDAASYPDDDAEHLAGQARRAGFDFPYLVDASQQVALAYRAACTPDFFLYDRERKLAYRGEFDDSRPRSGMPVTGEALEAAVEEVLAGKPVPEPHRPSIGCGIKWKPGNDPSG